MGTVSTVTIGTDTFSVYNLDDSDTPATNLTSHFNGRLGAAATAVAAATTDDKNRSLVMASDWIDRALEFSGEETTAGQPREWPRDGATCDGTAIPDGTTPDELAFATFDLAGLILTNNEVAQGGGQGSNVRSVQAGTASVEFFRPTIGTSVDRRLPQVAHDRLRCLLEGAAGIAGVSSFGVDDSKNDEQSHFECEDSFNLDRGYP